MLTLHMCNEIIIDEGLNCLSPSPQTYYFLKGNQKGKVTCYARERVNKNELF